MRPRLLTELGNQAEVVEESKRAVGLSQEEEVCGFNGGGTVINKKIPVLYLKCFQGCPDIRDAYQWVAGFGLMHTEDCGCKP